MNLITLDFETHYSREYSLTRLTTEEYIRHPDFEVIGVGIKQGDMPTMWVDQPDVKRALDSIDWSTAMVLAQNTMFDGAIMAWHYGINPKAWADTLGMSRALYPHEKGHSLAVQAERMGIGAKGDEVVRAMGKRRRDFTPMEIAAYADYCVNDVDLTYKLFNLYMKQGFPTKELRLIDLTLRLFIDPVLELDRDVLIKHLQEVKDHKANLLDTLRDMMIEQGNEDFVHTIFTEGTDGLKKLLMSNEKFAAALELLNAPIPLKQSPTTGRTTYAFAKTDAGMLSLQEHPNPQVQALVAARLGNKTTLEETRTERFIDMSFRGKFPVPLRYYGAHSGRWSGQDKINLQNLPSRGDNANKIKRAIKPPPGHVIIDCDSSQIEARTLAWLAGQEDLIEAFEQKKDVYRIMASHIYGIPPEEVTSGSASQRQVGKTVVLGAGYGVGPVKLRAFLKTIAGVEVSEREAKAIVDTYRSTYYRIPELWQKAQMALGYLSTEQEYEIDVQGLCRTERIRPGLHHDDWGITLPSGLWIQYPGLTTVYENGKAQSVYVSKGIATRVYGGLVVENCIAEGTEVLTGRGWVSIEQVQSDDLVHDGVEFVVHGGLVTKSVQPCVSIDGVWMTPDHEVLTNDGWKPASQNPEPYRPDLRRVDRAKPGAQQRVQTLLAVPLRLWGAVRKGWYRSAQGGETRGHTQLRMPYLAPQPRSPYHTRNEQASGVCGVSVHDRPMQATYPSGVGKLWRAGHQGMHAVAGWVRQVLGGYGTDLSTRIGFGSDQQRRPVFAAELPMGYAAYQHDEQAQYREARGRGGVEQGDRYLAHNALLPVGSRMASGSTDATAVAHKQVYDILDCGPRHRFVVRGTTGPFIVHNCCQAVARCVVGEQALRIAKRYKVVLTVHDAVACIAPIEEQAEAQRYVEECMSWRPDWAKTLPLACESGVGETYGDC